MIIAIDPGTEKSAYVIWSGVSIMEKGILDNEGLLESLNELKNEHPKATLVIEQIRSYGMAIGAETLDTVFWSGRFAERWNVLGGDFEMMPRLAVKMFWCHSAKAKDSNIWQAMVDQFGKPGTKKSPGFLFGVTSHERAALALAIAFAGKEVQP